MFDALILLNSLTSLSVRHCFNNPKEHFNPNEFQDFGYVEAYKSLKVVDLSENEIGINRIECLLQLKEL